jgi:hypothetical protein
MKASVCKTASVYLLGLLCLEQCVALQNLSPSRKHTHTLKPIQDQLYPASVSSYFMEEWIKALKSMKAKDMDMLVKLLRRPWMDE